MSDFHALLIKVDDANAVSSKLSRLQNYGWPDLDTTEDVSSGDEVQCGNMFYPFDIQKGSFMHRVILSLLFLLE